MLTWSASQGPLHIKPNKKLNSNAYFQIPLPRAIVCLGCSSLKKKLMHDCISLDGIALSAIFRLRCVSNWDKTAGVPHRLYSWLLNPHKHERVHMKRFRQATTHMATNLCRLRLSWGDLK